MCTIIDDELDIGDVESLASHCCGFDTLPTRTHTRTSPCLGDTTEMARLSGLVYSFRNHDACNVTDLDGDLDCRTATFITTITDRARKL
jgi:hypothetical protein